MAMFEHFNIRCLMSTIYLRLFEHFLFWLFEHFCFTS